MCTNTLIATINKFNLSRPATPERIRMDEMIEQVRRGKIYINECTFMLMKKYTMLTNYLVYIVGVTRHGKIKQ